MTTVAESTSSPPPPQLPPLVEARQILDIFTQSYPSTGLDAWTTGCRLAALFDQMVQWGLKLFAHAAQDSPPAPPTLIPSFTSPEEFDALWQRLDKNWPLLCQAIAAQISHQTALSGYPLRLRAFCERHRTLSTPIAQHYGDNDYELELLLQPILQLQAILEREAARLRPAATTEPRPWWKQWQIGLVGIVILGYAIASFFQRPAPPPKQLPANAVPGGIIGAYYQGRFFERLIQKRIDSNIWFHWVSSPAPGVSADQFSVRWVGFLNAPHTGPYKICTHHDDGTLVEIDNKAVIQRWPNAPDRTHCATIHMRKGWHRLVAQMNENSGPAVMQLSWQPPGTPHPQKIPSAHLCCRK